MRTPLFSPPYSSVIWLIGQVGSKGGPVPRRRNGNACDSEGRRRRRPDRGPGPRARGCQTKQGTATKIATSKGDVGPATWLAEPDGDGPFPAVVLAHGCGGTERNTQHQTVWRGLGRHAVLLNKNGYVTLIVDSFAPRRIRNGCQTGGKYYSLQVRDAHAAFDHLASLPFVDADRIGYVGQSLGSGTALRLALGSTVDFRAREGRDSYAALVAYYPWCGAARAYALRRPVLILTGAKDDWTPASRCIALDSLAEKSTIQRVVELEVYPDAHYSFDLPMQGPYYVEGMNGRFHTVQGDDRARRDSQERMLKFFKEHLGGSYEKARGGEGDILAYLGLRALLSSTASALSTD